MYSTKRFQEMTDREARAAIEDLAFRHYGTARWKTKFADDTGLARSSVQRWFMQTRPPTWALVLLAALFEKSEAVEKLAAIEKAMSLAFPNRS